MYALLFSKVAIKQLKEQKHSQPHNYKKIQKLLAELQEHPRSGTGHPEPLLGGNNELYSRRINKKDRLIYEIHDGVCTVLILTAEGHYSDK